MRRIISKRAKLVISDQHTQGEVINIEEAAERNNEFKATLWTGKYLKLNAMSIPIGGEIGKEIHTDTDQLIIIVSGRAKVIFGEAESSINFERIINDDYAIIIPAGAWHNVINIGDDSLKLISVYAPVV